MIRPDAARFLVTLNPGLVAAADRQCQRLGQHRAWLIEAALVEMLIDIEGLDQDNARGVIANARRRAARLGQSTDVRRAARLEMPL